MSSASIKSDQMILLLRKLIPQSNWLYLEQKTKSSKRIQNFLKKSLYQKVFTASQEKIKSDKLEIIRENIAV